ncbi:MAG TPA: hypothetical protein PKD53_28210, partial [Chloroflexaceae bacterium]|nr:hypothetical protein [Chloroflexaceae bacterium]
PPAPDAQRRVAVTIGRVEVQIQRPAPPPAPLQPPRPPPPPPTPPGEPLEQAALERFALRLR